MLKQIDGGPKLPGELITLWDDPTQEVFDEWSQMSLSDFGEAPQLQSYEDGSGSAIRYADLVPEGHIDEEHIIPLRLPIASGLAPHMFLRAKLIQGLLDVPTRLRIFPNDTYGESTIVLPDRAWQTVASGDFSPVARLQQASIEQDENLPDDVVNDNSGYSLGGVLAIEQSLIAPTRSLDFAEIPTFVDRTKDPKSLNIDALNGHLTLRPYNKAILDSGIPALAEAFGVKHKRSTLRQNVRGGLSFIRDTKLPTNTAMKSGLLRATASKNLGKLYWQQQDVSIVMAGAEGRIMPSDTAQKEYKALQELDQFPAIAYVAMSGYAHEAGDNIWTIALLSREARRTATSSPSPAA